LKCDKDTKKARNGIYFVPYENMVIQSRHNTFLKYVLLPNLYKEYIYTHTQHTIRAPVELHVGTWPWKSWQFRYRCLKWREIEFHVTPAMKTISCLVPELCGLRRTAFNRPAISDIRFTSVT